MVRTRSWLLLASLLVLTLLIANCAAPAAPADDAAPAAEATEAPAEEAAAAPEEAAPAGDAVELRIAWYSDGNEGVVLRELLDGFEAENPDIKVIVDELPYATGILANAADPVGRGRRPGHGSCHRSGRPFPVLSGPDALSVRCRPYWEENFGPFLTWLRPARRCE